MFAVRQLAAIDSLLSRPASQSVVDAARTALATVSLVGWLLLWPVARRMGASTREAGLAVGLSGLATLMSGLFGAVDAGALAALWLTVAAVLVGGRPARPPWSGSCDPSSPC